MSRSRFSIASFALGSVLVLGACGDSVDPGPGHGTLIVRADVSAATVAITLTPLTGDQAIVVTLGSFTITVTPSSPTVAISGTVQLDVAITDWNGAPTTGTVSWATQNPGIATVAATGLVTGAGVGSTKIAATFHGASGTATVGVTP